MSKNSCHSRLILIALPRQDVENNAIACKISTFRVLLSANTLFPVIISTCVHPRRTSWVSVEILFVSQGDFDEADPFEVNFEERDSGQPAVKLILPLSRSLR